MATIESERRPLNPKELARRVSLSNHFRRLKDGLMKISDVQQVGINVIAPIASLFAKTDKRVIQVVTDPSSYDGKEKFVATIRELDPGLFEAITNLPLNKRPPTGQEEDAVIRIVMQTQVVTEAHLITLLKAEFHQPPKLN